MSGRRFMLVEVYSDIPGANPVPEGTRALYNSDDLDEITEYLVEKTGQERAVLADGGERDGE